DGVRDRYAVAADRAAQRGGATAAVSRLRGAALRVHRFLCLRRFFAILPDLERGDAGGNVLVRAAWEGHLVGDRHVADLRAFRASIPDVVEDRCKIVAAGDDSATRVDLCV